MLVAKKSSPLNFLFIPVSSPEGIGEYMRSIIIAKQVAKTWPEANITFILSKQAPYAINCPFPVFLTPSSPTKHVKLVNDFIKDSNPDIVIFDASGRKSQLQQAKKHGAKVVFISQHKKKRSRGLKLGRISVTDCHWVVQPPFIMPDINCWEKAKLKWFRKSPPICTGPIFTPVDKVQQQKLLVKLNIEDTDFMLFNAGSGGHKVGDVLAADIYAQAAKYISENSQVTCLMLYGSNYPNDVISTNKMIAIKQLDNSDFINLIDAAKAVVISGGDTLLQTIALRKPCLTTPVSKDQPNRIRACVTNDLVLSCSTNSEDIIKTASKLLDSNTQRRLSESLRKSNLTNGLDIAMSDITKLVNISTKDSHI